MNGQKFRCGSPSPISTKHFKIAVVKHHIQVGSSEHCLRVAQASLALGICLPVCCNAEGSVRNCVRDATFERA